MEMNELSLAQRVRPPLREVTVLGGVNHPICNVADDLGIEKLVPEGRRQKG